MRIQITMDTKFKNYTEAIQTLNLSLITETSLLPKSLLIDTDGGLSIYYVPFDYINQDAKIVIVGITPGFTQLKNALIAAQSNIALGRSVEETLIDIKKKASFSGAMRKNLVDMLDFMGIQKWLSIGTCADLFNNQSHLLHSTSALKYPVFIKGENYNGTPNMTKHPLLKSYLLANFGKEAEMLKNAIFVPLGPKPAEAMQLLVQNGVVDESRILFGLPHPSPASMERINYFLEKKEKSKLSIKTNPDVIDNAKQAIIDKLKRLNA